MSIASKFDSFFYLLENPDVLSAVNNNDFKDAFSHFEAFGHIESRQPNQLFNTTYYILNNPDVADALNSGLFKHAFEHYLTLHPLFLIYQKFLEILFQG